MSVPALLEKHKTKLVILAGGLGTIGLITWANRLSRIANEIVIITASDFNKKTGEYIVRVTIKNPVTQAITVKYPFVRINYGDTVVASSAPNSSFITIPANGSSETTIRIAFDKEKLATSIPSLATILFSGGKVELKATTLTGLKNFWGITEFSKQDTWKIGW